MSMLKDVRDASAVATLLFEQYEAIFADVRIVAGLRQGSK